MKYSHNPVYRVGLAIFGLLALLPMVWFTASTSTADTPFSIFAPQVTKPCPIVPIPMSGNWLEYLNFYRATSCLPPAIEYPVLSDGAYQHAIYIVKNDELLHNEDPTNPWYTPEGHAAAQQSNLAGSWDVTATDIWAIDTWMQAPFHAVGILDPHLDEVGYGSYREADGNLQMGAAVNVLAGLSYDVNSIYPFIWPGNGTTIPIRLHWGEYPSPLTSCSGYTAPSGVPIIVQVGSGDITPLVSASSFTQNGQPLEHCVFDETSYTNPDSTQQNLGRNILGSRDAIVLIPRRPLSAGATYEASITVDGNPINWSFSISSPAH